MPLDFYEFPVAVPEKCIYRPGDPVSGSAAVGDLDRVSQIVVQLTPDATATFLPSRSPPPVTPIVASFGLGKLKHLGKCLYGMEVFYPVELENLTFAASARTAVVEARDPNGGPNLRLETLHIPCSCSPERLSLISWWAGTGPLGFPYVILYVAHEGDRPTDNCKDHRLRKVSLASLDGPVDYTKTPFYRKTQ
ncbi:hypothetical protein, conserved [Eimeria maxima]|uniref:Uncharacterized protein n=1 Tax=Eimeria maxima TaxID=5804 RepID=U6MAP9_EIMMA|nr:hypothetical protein, conserved [Eimeria maxima]CDJ61302.1 hypothetical protein, conserved [Eimeria maxima]